MVKAKYLDLIQFLRKDARTSLTNISKKTKTPISTLHDRLKATEEKYIQRHTSLLDFDSLGYKLRAKVLLCSNAREKIADFIKINKNINSASHIQGDYDYLLECIFKDVPDFNKFLNEISTLPILSKQIYFVNQDLKKEAFLA